MQPIDVLQLLWAVASSHAAAAAFPVAGCAAVAAVAVAAAGSLHAAAAVCGFTRLHSDRYRVHLYVATRRSQQHSAAQDIADAYSPDASTLWSMGRHLTDDGKRVHTQDRCRVSEATSHREVPRRGNLQVHKAVAQMTLGHEAGVEVVEQQSGLCLVAVVGQQLTLPRDGHQVYMPWSNRKARVLMHVCVWGEVRKGGR